MLFFLKKVLTYENKHDILELFPNENIKNKERTQYEVRLFTN